MEAYDLIILGAGCAGLTAGIYAGRLNLRTLILENGMPGGQAATTGILENYPGIIGITGPALTGQMLKQAREFGCDYIPCSVNAVNLQEKQVDTDHGSFRCGAMILATGATPRELGVPGEKEFRGRGVSYCAHCDGFFFKGREILVVGGGSTAAENALHLAAFGRKVTVLVRKDAMRCQPVLLRRMMENDKIEIRYRTELLELRGDLRVESAVLRNAETGETEEITAPDGLGIFISIGYTPNSSMFTNELEPDENGYILTDDTLGTKIPGVFAAGDVRAKKLRQIITAAADGAIAATEAAQFLHQSSARNS